MAMLLRLPLTKDYNNYGILNPIVSVPSTISLTGNGKIGNCPTGPSDAGIRVTLSGITSYLANGKKYSFACWAKKISGIDGWIVQFGTNQCGLWFGSNNDNPRWVWNENNNGRRIANTTVSGDYDWHHIVVTIDKSTPSSVIEKYYFDGKVSTVASSTYDASGLNQPTGDTVFIGTNIAYLNDIRLYDYILSEEEIVELAKGLVIHYPLSLPGQENLLKDTLTSPPVLWGTAKNNGATMTTQNDVTVSEWGCTDAKRAYGKAGSSSTLFGIILPCDRHWAQGDPVSVSGQKYACSIYIKNNHVENTLMVNINGLASTVVIQPSESKLCTAIATGNGKQYVQFNIHASAESAEYDFTYWHPKIELGEKATPWMPNSEDSIYTALGYDNNIIYDVSGFKHNANTYGTENYSSDTARYSTSMNFNGTNDGVIIPNLSISEILNNQCTIAFWIKPNGEAGGRSVYFSSYNQTSWSIEKTSLNKLRSWWNGSPDTTTNLTISDNAWQHIAIVKNGTSSIKFYYNGALVQEITTVHNNLNFGTTWRLGRDTRENDGTPYKGLMSDFRVYATALSATDVLELYNTVNS